MACYLTAPTIEFKGIKNCDSFIVISDPMVGYVYNNNNREKRVLTIDEIPKFYDSTLIRVHDKINKRVRDNETGYDENILLPNELDKYQMFEK